MAVATINLFYGLVNPLMNAFDSVGEATETEEEGCCGSISA